jgi:quercetin dioxygenase-like cupin family protein
MALHVRRVVTGHDSNGKACVISDEPMSNIISKRPGYESTVVWSTDAIPSDNSGPGDDPTDGTGQTMPNGAVFRVVSYEPGVAPRIHRTDSLDFAIVLAGAIDMELDDGVVVHLETGDTIIQRGTVHNWINSGTVTCKIAFVLLGAQPVTIGGQPLPAHG